MGADPADARVRQGCDSLLRHNLAVTGAFSANRLSAPRGVLHCLNGNLVYALIQLGFTDDPQVQTAVTWQAQSIIGHEAITYYASVTSGPGFACGVNGKLPCAWGANKAMKALVAIPPAQRTPLVEQAIALGVEFLFSRDPAVADYPTSDRVSGTWFKLGFPLSYWSDVLETATVLAEVGYGDDPLLDPAIRFILDKQVAPGRWKLENSLNGKMWLDIEKRGKPSKWVTLRAMRLLQRRARREETNVPQH